MKKWFFQSTRSQCLCSAALAACLLAVTQTAMAESKRIIVYPLSQSYVDTHEGDTLGEIAARLLPNNPNLQQQLMGDIVKLNPDAFIGNNPDQLLANTRLWLPNRMHKHDSKPDPKKYKVESFSWGNIKKPR